MNRNPPSTFRPIGSVLVGTLLALMHLVTIASLLLAMVLMATPRWPKQYVFGKTPSLQRSVVSIQLQRGLLMVHVTEEATLGPDSYQSISWADGKAEPPVTGLQWSAGGGIQKMTNPLIMAQMPTRPIVGRSRYEMFYYFPAPRPAMKATTVTHVVSAEFAAAVGVVLLLVLLSLPGVRRFWRTRWRRLRGRSDEPAGFEPVLADRSDSLQRGDAIGRD